MNGFIILHKKLLEWEWYGDANTSRVFIHCLLKANYTDKKWRGELIKRGQFITSINKLSTELEMSIQKTRTTLDKLISTNEISKKVTNHNTLITVIKYDYYQRLENFIHKHNNISTNTSITSHQLLDNNPITTTKEYKEKEKNKNENKKERDAHIFLKNDKLFWNNFLANYKNQVFDFDLMLKKFDLKIREENFPFIVTKLAPRLERWTLSWIKNQKKDTKEKFIPHR